VDIFGDFGLRDTFQERIALGRLKMRDWKMEHNRNVGAKNEGQKMQGWKMRDWKMEHKNVTDCYA